jgi:ABC-2 type transport system permease protein
MTSAPNATPGAAPEETIKPARPDTALGPVQGVWLVARREVTTRVRSRTFLISAAILLALLAGYGVFTSVVGNISSKQAIGLTVPNVHLAEPLKAQMQSVGADVETREVVDIADGQRQLVDGQLAMLVTGPADNLRVVVKQNPDSKLLAGLDSLAQRQVLDNQLSQAGLDPNTVHRTVADTHVAVRSLQPADPAYKQRLALGLISMLLLYSSLQTFGTTVAQGVVEEKSSRVVELLLSAIRPWQLLFGKVLGVGLVSVLQFVAIGVLGIIGTTLTGQLTIPVTAVAIMLSDLGWYLMGFLLIATALAAAASLVSRQEDLSSVLAPVTMILLIPFLFGFNLLVNDPSGQLVQVLSLIPPFGPMFMPSRIALGSVPLWQVAVSLALTAAVVALLAWLAGRIYTNAVLRFGGRVKLRDALRA